MPLLKANEPMPLRPVVISLYGEPGSCKTTLANTSSKVLVLDFDRGVSRSYFRQDTLIVNNWEEVLEWEQQGKFAEYNTIAIDTAKACLDDFLMSYVITQDYKLKTNKLKAYGAIGDEFKLFLNNRRTQGMDVVIIAHAKKDEDTKKNIPDVTGQSYNLILRVSDQVGYVSFVNNQRHIQWSPTDLTIGKNTANLPEMQVPDKADPKLKTFMADVIATVKQSLVSMSEAQLESIKIMEAYQDALSTLNTPEGLTKFLHEANELPAHLKAPLVKQIADKAKSLGFVPNKETKQFELPAENKNTAAEKAPAPAPVIAPPATPVKQNDEPITEEDEVSEEAEALQFRSKMLSDIGMTMEVDQATYGPEKITYVELSKLSDTQFNDLVAKIVGLRKAKKSGKKATA